jgi:hypothetical protein
MRRIAVSVFVLTLMMFCFRQKNPAVLIMPLTGPLHPKSTSSSSTSETQK